MILVTIIMVIDCFEFFVVTSKLPIYTLLYLITAVNLGIFVFIDISMPRATAIIIYVDLY